MKFWLMPAVIIFVGWNFQSYAETTVEISVQPPIGHGAPRFMPPPPMPFVVKPRNKIWTPDKYSCYMRQTKKYCVDYKGRPLSGRIVVTDSESAAYETYLNGYRSGETSIYSLSGVLLERTMYKKGVKNGESMRYFMNGNIHWLAKYKDGALNGWLEEYDVDGALLGRLNYKKGWFKDGFCRNEKSGHSMHERLKGQYNQIIPCGEAEQ
jgi:hypothetical protein